MSTKKRSKVRRPKRMNAVEAGELEEALSRVAARKSQTDFQYFVLSIMRERGISLVGLADRLTQDTRVVRHALTHAGARVDLRLVGSIFYALGLDVEVRIDGKGVVHHTKAGG